MEQSLWIICIVFCGWTTSSFICHFSAKCFLKIYADHFDFKSFDYNVIVLTGIQILFWIATTSFPAKADGKHLNTHKFVIIAAHACATLTTNWSMSVTYAASTFAIKLMEPVTGVIAQRFFLDIKISQIQYLSIPVVVIGAFVFAYDVNGHMVDGIFGTSLAILSNICLALRNVYIKKNHISKNKITFNKVYFCIVLFGTIVFGTTIYPFLQQLTMEPQTLMYLHGLLVTSASFHVLYSYISTVIVLKNFSIVGHAYGNIVKRLIVLGLFYVLGARNANIENFFGLFVCITGLIVYVWSTQQQHELITLTTAITVYKRKHKLLRTALIVMTVGGFIMYQDTTRYTARNIVKPVKIRTMFANDQYSNDTYNMPTSSQLNFDIQEFYKADLVKYPELSNKLSPFLKKRTDVINEAQRIHLNIFQTLLGSYKYAMLFDYFASENKGDSAIGVGEFILLRKLKIEIIFVCYAVQCQSNIDNAVGMSKQYTNKELVILFHGGGNVIGWPSSDKWRQSEITRFMDFHIVMFPQSILYIEPQSHIDFCKKLYASHNQLTFIWRDRNSYQLGKDLFPKIHSLLAPDIAYQIGYVPRFMLPTFDILWLQRTDKESPNDKAPVSIDGYTMHVADWLKWETPSGNSTMESIFLMTANGMMFLQRGRIVITDRLHGHILSTLMGIPHVYIDNKQKKISNYHNTWTAGLNNVVLANSSADAVLQANVLLAKLDKELPKIEGFFNLG